MKRVIINLTLIASTQVCSGATIRVLSEQPTRRFRRGRESLSYVAPVSEVGKRQGDVA